MQNSIAKSTYRTKVTATTGQKCSVKGGAEFPTPPNPRGNVEFKPHEYEVDLTVLPNGNGVYRADMMVRLAKANYGKTAPIGNQDIPAIHHNTRIANGIELPAGIEYLLPAVYQQQRTEAVRRNGIIELNQIDFETAMLITILPIAPDSPSAALQPASATLPAR